jgi:hypothetical protein
MQVLRHHQQRALLRVAIEQLRHFAQHAIRPYAGQVPSQRLTLLCGAEPWQLQEPRRRDRAYQRHRRGVAPAQLSERFQTGQVRFADAILLHALTTNARYLGDACDEMLDQRGLADARITRNPHDGALACTRTLPGGMKA